VVQGLARDDVAVRELTPESQRIRSPSIVMQRRPYATAPFGFHRAQGGFRVFVLVQVRDRDVGAFARIEDRARVCIARTLPPMRHGFPRQT